MQIYTNQTKPASMKRGVGLGNFDGVHIGHAELMRVLKDACNQRGIPAMVYTFANHPNHVLGKMVETPLIITNEQKSALVDAFGIDELYFEHFDRAYASMEPETFVEEILVRKLQAQVVVVGHNYSFGSFGKGDADLLAKLGQRYGFEVIAVPHVMRNIEGTEEEVVVSSTVLRRMIREGRMEEFSNLTGRHYSIPGHVVEGRHVGRSLGYPTANILPREGFALPDFGVYASVTVRNGKAYRSVTNIGNNPTFAGIDHVTVETFLLDFEGALYGAAIEVYFLRKMRGECKFESAQALQDQLRKDVASREAMGDVSLKGIHV
jgi:riboflavin kinase/FMN adenylyltransferase